MPTMTRAGYVPEKKPEPPKPPKKPAKKKKRKKRGMSGAAIASLVVFALAVCIGAASIRSAGRRVHRARRCSMS